MSLKNKIIQGIVICVAFLLLTDSAYSFKRIVSSSKESARISHSTKGKSFSGSNPFLASSMKIGLTETGIKIQVRNGLLVDVLQQITNHTNIQFRIADHLNSQRINVNIQAKNWDSGVERLLKDFSKVTVWDKFSRIENILLMGTNIEGSQTGSETAQFGDQVAGYQISKKKPNPGLSVSKLKQLVKIQPGNTILADLFADKEIRNYLKLKGIHSPNDLKQSKKRRVVQHLAKRELIKLLYEQQSRSKVN